MTSLLTPAAYLVAAVTAFVDPVAPQPQEMADMHAWAAAHFGLPAASGPSDGKLDLSFSFTCAGRPFAEIGTDWKTDSATRGLDATRTEQTLTWRDPKTGLAVRCVAVQYADFPTIEWTVYFKNEGSADSPILADIQALDASFERGPEGEFLLHHAVGSPADGSDYSPLETPLGPNAAKRISAAGGRPTNSDLSYFNVQWPGRGTIVVVGWPGQWATRFERDAGKGLRLIAGQELTNLKLHPGEEIRTPLIVLQFWRGDYLRSQNIWRRWMITHNMPRPAGKLPAPLLAAGSSRWTNEMVNATEQNQIQFIDRFVEEQFGLDYWWMDAGWYIIKTNWTDTGTWEVDPKRFPGGLRPISDYAASRNMKTVVWFEPERVMPGSWLYEKHPEWLLGKDGGRKLFDLGNAEARTWLVDHVDKLITEQRIGLYRQDFNMDPLAYWRAADAPDRQGITENKHVCGLLAYWDELQRRHPDVLIDECASGGRRNDLESMRRAVPLWRSDRPYVAPDQQSMTLGISRWLPYHGTATVACTDSPYYGGGWTAVEPYMFWSNTAPSLGVGIDIRERGIDYPALRRLIAQWRELSRYYYADFYPLLACNRLPDAWAAWQFDRPDVGDGAIQVFRRAESPYEAVRLQLHGLEPQARYTLADLNRQVTFPAHTGRELTDPGLLVTLPAKPSALVITYRRQP